MRDAQHVAADADPGDVHIAGVLVHSRPLYLMQVHHAIDALDAAEVFQSSAEGKIVVVIEAPSGRQVLDVLDIIRSFAGVLNVSLVYQHAEPMSSMQQELP
jgi:nitrate reductase NapD